MTGARRGTDGLARGFVVALAAAAALAEPAPALGATPPASPAVSLTAAPMFGADATNGVGWTEVVARIDNTSAVARKGDIELLSEPSYGGGEKFTTRAPFSVPAGKGAVVRLPIHASTYYGPALTVTARDGAGQKLATTTISLNGTPAPMLLDIDQPSRLSVVMRSWPIAVAWSPRESPYAAPPAGRLPLSVGAPAFDRTTGDPVLPERAAGYAAVTAVLVHSDVLARLDAGALDALSLWVLAGGTLGVVPNRPEDLRGPVLTTLVGGVVTTTQAPSRLRGLASATRPSMSPGATPTETDEADTPPSPPPSPPPPPSPASPGAPIPMAFGSGGHAAVVPLAQPSGRGSPASVRDTLTGYAGGNLRPSDLGASAPYGLGEVHLLAFDPTSPAALEDGWSHGRVLEMIGRAWERRATIAFPHGAGERTDYRLDEIRRALDPNENFRPGLGASAVLLLLYSIFVGPVAFSRAMKKGKPLRALAWAPLLSAAAFGAIVLVGFASKGWRGRARHIALVEAGAGVTRGTVRRYRGLFSSETQSLTVRATDRWSVLDVASADSSSQTNAVLRVDRDGASLENLTSLPWQTVVIREDGFVDWKGAISVLANADGSADVVNRSGHRVRDLMVWLPGSGVSWFAELNDGARVRSSAGKQVLAPTARHHSTSGTRTVHAMGAHDIGFAATARSDGHLTKAWSPFETAATEAVDWWPDELPVAMGELVGVEKAPRDSGLALESEVVLFRVTGYGGTP